MDEKLQKLYQECIQEMENIGIQIIDNKDVGQIEIKLSKRNNKRYGACKQLEPDKTTMYIEKIKYSFYRQRLNKNFTRKYRCGKCGGSFKVINIDQYC